MQMRVLSRVNECLHAVKSCMQISETDDDRVSDARQATEVLELLEEVRDKTRRCKHMGLKPELMTLILVLA